MRNISNRIMVKLNSVSYDIEYPIYGAKFLNDKTLLVTGGGGQGNQENSNRLTALTINLTKKKKPIKKFRELKLKEENDAPSCLDSNNNIILLGCNEGQASIKDGHNHNLQKFIYINDHLKYVTSTSLENDILPSIYQKFITISKDGSIAAVASSKIPTLIHILDPVNLFEKYEIETNNEVKDLDISPDGKNLTYITKTNTIEIISIITGRSLLRRVDFDKNYNLTKVKFIDDDHVILGVSLKDGNGISLVKLSLSQKLKTVKEIVASKKIKSITAIDINLKNGVIAIAGNENSIILFKVQSLKSIKTFSNVHSLSITKITFSPNGEFLASVSVANTVNVIEIPDALGIETHHIYNFFKRSLQLLILAVVIQLAWKYYQSRDVKKLDFSEYFTLTPRSAATQTSTTSSAYYEPKITTAGYIEDEEEPEEIVEREEDEEDDEESTEEEEVEDFSSTTAPQPSTESSTKEQPTTTETESSAVEPIETKTETSVVEVTASTTETSTVSETSISTETSTTELTSLTTETTTVEESSTSSEPSTTTEPSTTSEAKSEPLLSSIESTLSSLELTDSKPHTTALDLSTLSSKETPASTSETFKTETEILYDHLEDKDVQFESISEIPPTAIILTSTVTTTADSIPSSSSSKTKTKTKKKNKSLRRRKKKSTTATVSLTTENSAVITSEALSGSETTNVIQSLTSQASEAIVSEADAITSKLGSKLSEVSVSVHGSSSEDFISSLSITEPSNTESKPDITQTSIPASEEIVTPLTSETEISTNEEVTSTSDEISEIESTTTVETKSSPETVSEALVQTKLTSSTKSIPESDSSDSSIGVAGTIPIETTASTPFTAETIETPVPETPEAIIEPGKLLKDAVEEDAEPATEVEAIIPDATESLETAVESSTQADLEETESPENENEFESDTESLTDSEDSGSEEDYETADEPESSDDEWDTASEGSITTESSESGDEGYETAEDEPIFEESQEPIIESVTVSEPDSTVESIVEDTITETLEESDPPTSETEQEIDTDFEYETDSSTEELETDTESELDTDEEITDSEPESDIDDELESTTDEIITSDEEDYTSDSDFETDEITTPEVEEPIINEEVTTTSIEFHDEL